MLKAGSLNYAIFLALVAGIICMLMILMVYQTKVVFNQTDLQQRLMDNSHSGIAMGMAAAPGVSTRQVIDLQGLELLSVSKKPWGAFHIVSTLAKHQKYSYQKTALIGLKLANENLALYHSQKNSPLSLTGKSLLKGDVSISKRGVKASYIENMHFEGEKLVEGNISISKPELPPLYFDFNHYWKQYLNRERNLGDSIIALPLHVRETSNSFGNQTGLFYQKSPIVLTKASISGNIIIQSESEIIVDSSASLTHVVLIAPVIRIANHAELACHIIATDSVIVGQRVKMNYPSSIILLKSNHHGICRISEGAVLKTNILCFSDTRKRSNDIQLEVAGSATIWGSIYCEGNFQNKGTISGCVFAGNILLKTASGVYENHIMNGKIDRPSFPTDLESAVMYPSSSSMILSWL